MKRKLLTILLCVSMSVTLLVGCGTKDVDATNDEVAGSNSVKEENTVKVTKKLEEEYVARIEAYQEYYEKECDDYEYIVSARITIDEEGLPLLWLWYTIDENPDSTQTTQLLSCESGEVKVLAELRNTCVCPLVSDEVVAALEWGEENVYIYDADNALFRKIEVPEDEWKEYINETLEEFSYYEYCICVNEEEQELSYIGKTNGRTDNYGASFEETTVSEVASSDEGTEVAQPPVPYVDRIVVEIEENDEKFFYADGSVGAWEQAKEELDILEDYESSMLRIAEGGVEWLTEFEVDTMFRVLKSQPAYSSEQLVMTLVANSLYFEHSDGTVYSIGDSINLKDYNLSKASDKKINNLVLDYVYEGEFDPRYMEESLYEQLDTEPYVTFRGRCSVGGYDWSWDIDDEEYSDNVATFAMDDGTVCQFLIEFTEDGDKISKITYIDPMAAMSEEEKQQYMVEHEVLPAYEKYISENLGVFEYSVYNLIYLDDDDVPELLYDSTADGRGTELLYYQNGEVIRNPAPCRGFGFYYIPRGNKVIYVGAWDADIYGTVAYLNEGILNSEHTYAEDYDMNADSYMYSIDDAECTKEEYADFVEAHKNGTVYGWDTYSSIQEAYDNFRK